MAEFRAATGTQPAFLDALLERGLLIASGVPGLYGRSAVFEDVRLRFVEAVRRVAAIDAPERLAFPPLIPREQLDQLGYLKTFPHLAGVVTGFGPGDDGGLHEQPAGVALTPAACYPVYPAIAARGPVPAGGVTVEATQGCVFRNEPSDDPARMQLFHQLEMVRIGAPEVVMAWRDRWRDDTVALLCGLGLDAQHAVASDPFFGRAGRILARGQRQQELKFEVLAPLAGDEPTAVASFNAHQAHFAEVYGLQAEDGTPVHTACLGFGQERVVLALLHQHGLDPDAWPAAVRAQLWGNDG